MCHYAHLLKGNAQRRWVAWFQRGNLMSEGFVGLRLDGGPDGRSRPGQKRLPAHPRAVIDQLHACAQRPAINEQYNVVIQPAIGAQLAFGQAYKRPRSAAIGTADLLGPTAGAARDISPKAQASVLLPEFPGPAAVLTKRR